MAIDLPAASADPRPISEIGCPEPNAAAQRGGGGGGGDTSDVIAPAAHRASHRPVAAAGAVRLKLAKGR
jgi:hypothetical protein